MKKYFVFNLLLWACSVCMAQDTSLTVKSWKLKIGAKYISEHSARHVLTDSAAYHVNNFGIPLIIRFGRSKSSIETGLYYTGKKETYELDYSHYYSSYYYYNNPRSLIAFHYLRVPINYRLDTRIVYVSGGFCIDNLISITNKTDKTDVSEFFPGRKFKTGFNINVGIEKDISKQVSIFGEFRFSSDFDRSFFNPGFVYVNDEPLQNLGFGLGANFNVPRKK